MKQDEFWSDKLAEMVDLIERQERGEPDTSPIHWLDELKREVEARRMAEAQAQYKRDAIMTRLMFELNRVRAVELLEEMNRELLDRQGRVEPVYNGRHELNLSWALPGGRNRIRVGAEYIEATSEVFLIVTGKEEQRVPANEEDLKNALVRAFREPYFDIYRW
ncbi:MAG TPA: hypothetical protein VH186_29840 [Chloroflexia bacterium]|nr:hypothetical protein [Chloroflexia bacterium]